MTTVIQTLKAGGAIPLIVRATHTVRKGRASQTYRLTLPKMWCIFKGIEAGYILHVTVLAIERPATNAKAVERERQTKEAKTHA